MKKIISIMLLFTFVYLPNTYAQYIAYKDSYRSAPMNPRISTEVTFDTNFVTNNENLTKNKISKVIGVFTGQIKYCYEKHFQKEPDFSGELRAYLTISTTGEVIIAQIPPTTTNNPIIELCVMNIFRRMSFPAPGSTQVQAVCHLSFNKENKPKIKKPSNDQKTAHTETKKMSPTEKKYEEETLKHIQETAEKSRKDYEKMTPEMIEKSKQAHEIANQKFLQNAEKFRQKIKEANYCSSDADCATIIDHFADCCRIDHINKREEKNLNQLMIDLHTQTPITDVCANPCLPAPNTHDRSSMCRNKSCSAPPSKEELELRQ